MKETVWRKHWWVLVKALWGPVCWMGRMLLFDLLLALIAWVVVGMEVQVSPGSWIVLGASAVGLWVPLIAWGAWEVIDWWNDRYILTPTHAVDEQKKPFLGGTKRIAVDLQNIQSVSFVMADRMDELLKIGNVVIESAGKRTVYWNGIPKPKKVAAKIEEAALARQQAVRQEEIMVITDAITGGFEEVRQCRVS